MTQPVLNGRMPDDLDLDRPLPRVAVHVDLHSVSRDLQELKAELARRPTRSEIARLALGCLAAVVVALWLLR
jgi:hypothetical protein